MVHTWSHTENNDPFVRACMFHHSNTFAVLVSQGNKECVWECCWFPAIGLQAMWAVEYFVLGENGFEGALPEIGLQSMCAVRDFWIYRNHFEGALPAIGLRSMCA
eukprot:5110223-Amphidinium_carterae.2